MSPTDPKKPGQIVPPANLVPLSYSVPADFATLREMGHENLVQLAYELLIQNNILLGLSTTDALTGLPNRRSIMEKLESIHRAGPVGIAIIDIDNFKRVNDELGHSNGDEALRLVAGTMQNSMDRKSNFVGRYGGEEFIAVFPGIADAVQLGIRIEKLRKAVEAINFVPAGSDERRPLTVSVGAIMSSDTRSRVEDTLIAADHALYHSKRDGKNRTTIVDAGNYYHATDDGLKNLGPAWKPDAPNSSLLPSALAENNIA